jgi:type IV secretion system protein VirB10
MMTAVLETAINTEIPGSIRGIISRDVYAESGFNILIPKGSRLFGSYSTNIVRGQGRVEINWSRLIRPDGVDLSIGFVAADQFGRSGIEGDVNNKYGAALTNSLLTSILAIGGAIGAEKLSGADNNTTTSSPTTGTTTMTSSPSAQVIADVATTLVSTVSEISTNAINLSPVIRVPQGTKMTIVVNADMSIPKMRGRR